MYVCICNGVTDHRIRHAVAEGYTDFEALRERLNVATCCGCCEAEVREILREPLRKPNARRPLHAGTRHEHQAALR